MRAEPWMDEPEDSRRYQMMYGGIAVYTDSSLPPGTVQLRNRDGEIVATILNIKQIDVRG